jgi:hypothetical protein
MDTADTLPCISSNFSALPPATCQYSDEAEETPPNSESLGRKFLNHAQKSRIIRRFQDRKEKSHYSIEASSPIWSSANPHIITNHLNM